MLLIAFSRPSESELVDPDFLGKLHSKLWQPLLQQPVDRATLDDEALRIELCHMSTLIIRARSDIVVENKKDVIKFGWVSMRFDDITVTQVGCIWLVDSTRSFADPAPPSARPRTSSSPSSSSNTTRRSRFSSRSTRVCPLSLWTSHSPLTSVHRPPQVAPARGARARPRSTRRAHDRVPRAPHRRCDRACDSRRAHRRGREQPARVRQVDAQDAPRRVGVDPADDQRLPAPRAAPRPVLPVPRAVCAAHRRLANQA